MVRILRIREAVCYGWLASTLLWLSCRVMNSEYLGISTTGISTTTTAAAEISQNLATKSQMHSWIHHFLPIDIKIGTDDDETHNSQEEGERRMYRGIKVNDPGNLSAPPSPNSRYSDPIYSPPTHTLLTTLLSTQRKNYSLVGICWLSDSATPLTRWDIKTVGTSKTVQDLYFFISRNFVGDLLGLYFPVPPP